MPDLSAVSGSVRYIEFLFMLSAVAELLAVGVVVYVAIITGVVTTGAVDEVVDGVVSLVLALVMVNPAGA